MTMGLFGLLFGENIDEGVRRFAASAGAVLLDVRTQEEYAGGHIEGSVNVPLDRLGGIAQTIPDKDTPVFVYCLSGARSGQAVEFLRRMGYGNVKNIGGISSYHGKVVR